MNMEMHTCNHAWNSPSLSQRKHASSASSTLAISVRAHMANRRNGRWRSCEEPPASAKTGVNRGVSGQLFALEQG